MPERSPSRPRGLAVWEQAVRSCTSCALSAGRLQAVCFSGPTPCDLVLLGEAPGQREDETGLPFQGASGRLLDEVLFSLGRPRETVHVSNAVRCRPPGNRTPTSDEIATCRRHLARELELVSPTVIVTLGASAARALGVLGRTQALSAIRSVPVHLDGRLVLPTLHPAAVLRNRPKNMQLLRDDLANAIRIATTRRM